MNFIGAMSAACILALFGIVVLCAVYGGDKPK